MRLRILLFLFLLGWSAVALGQAIPVEGQRGTVCEFPDLSDVDSIWLSPGAAPAAGVGGDIPGGRWELVAVRYATDPSGFDIVGNARSVLALDAAGPSSGQASLALEVAITEPLLPEIDDTGAGPYSAVGNLLSVQNDCGDALMLGDETEYSIDSSGPEPQLTLWGETYYVITFPVLIEVTIFLEGRYELVEPQVLDDPVFADRFEESDSGQ